MVNIKSFSVPFGAKRAGGGRFGDKLGENHASETIQSQNNASSGEAAKSPCPLTWQRSIVTAIGCMKTAPWSNIRVPVETRGRMSKLNQQIQLPDGRKLGYDERGPSNGKPLFYFHGLALLGRQRIEWGWTAPIEKFAFEKIRL